MGCRDLGVAQHGKDEMMTEDPFEKIRTLTMKREQAQDEWREEVRYLRAAGFSTRAIAQVAGVSHDTIWKVR